MKKREREAFGSRIEAGGDMYQAHLDFIQWAKAYDNGGMEMRSRVKHDEWQKLLTCDLLILDGCNDLDYNFSVIKGVLQAKE